MVEMGGFNPNPEGSQTIGADPVRFAQALLGDVVFVRLLIKIQ